MAFYGVANPLPIAAVYATVSGADVTCNAGTETTIVTTGALTALNAGPYYPLIWLAVTVVQGGTKPSALVYAFKLGSGSDVDTFTVEPGQLSNSGELFHCFPLIGANSATAWIGSGSTINITANATAQAVTVKNVGTRALVQLVRGPDV